VAGTPRSAFSRSGAATLYGLGFCHRQNPVRNPRFAMGKGGHLGLRKEKLFLVMSYEARFRSPL